jgi:hypothetical protein
MTGDRTQIKFYAQAGEIYVIYAEITAPQGRRREQTWRPIIVNINNYRKEECEKYNCVDTDRIKELATKYLQSERRIMTYHPLEKPHVVESGGTRRVINGFWW